MAGETPPEGPRSIVREPALLLAAGLALLMVAYAWPERDTVGTQTVTLSILQGVRFPGQDPPLRSVLYHALRPVLLWLVAVAAVIVPVGQLVKALVLGALLLFGISEFLLFASRLIADQFVGPSVVIGITAGTLVVAGAVSVIQRSY